jgi:H+-translocating NAD(P) transhydrogenase subunit beta
MLSAVAMLIAIVATMIEIGLVDPRWIVGGIVVGAVIGAVAAIKVQMTEMPEMVALFNGFGGGASALVAISTAISSWSRPPRRSRTR